MVVFGRVRRGQSNLVNMYYGDRRRRHRKRTHGRWGVGVQQVRNYRGLQNGESKVVAFDSLRELQEYVKHFERYATSAVLVMGFRDWLRRCLIRFLLGVLLLCSTRAELIVPGKRFPILIKSFSCELSKAIWM